MPGATIRFDSSFVQFQRRTPKDVLEVAAGARVYLTLPATSEDPKRELAIFIAPQIKFSLRVRDKRSGQARTAAVQAQLLQEFGRLLSKETELPFKTLRGLAGEVYLKLHELYEDEPGRELAWERFKMLSWGALHGHLQDAPPLTWEFMRSDEAYQLRQFGRDVGPWILDKIEDLPALDSSAGLEMRFGNFADEVLQKHGLSVTRATRLRLLQEIAEACLDAGMSLKRKSTGDYSDDEAATRFPPVTVPASKADTSIRGVFESWKREAKPKPSTISNWTTVVNDFSEFVNARCLEKVLLCQLVDWKVRLMNRGLSTKTIRDTYVACIRALFNFAHLNGMITANVARSLKVTHRVKAGESMLPYSDAEVAALLEHAQNERAPSKHWIPVLAACSGARVGELAQLWGQSIRTDGSIWVMDLRPAPDGGSFKNAGSERTVPLHPHLISAGFLDFVHDRGPGPLFYRTNKSSTGRHASKGVTNHLSTWIRTLPGFVDERKSPMHAVRHWWKSKASEIGVSDSRADAITGHAKRTVGDQYRHFSTASLLQDVSKIEIPRA